MTNPNTPGLSGILGGLSSLLQGIGQFKDPDQEQREKLAALIQANPNLRDQYLTQFQGNPEAINALIGRAPRFGDKSGYINLYSTLAQGKLSPEGQAKQDRAKAESIAAQNAARLGEGNARVIATGQAEEAANPRGMQSRIAGRDESGKQILEVPIGLFQNPADRAKYQELQTEKGVLTPAERTSQSQNARFESARAGKEELELGAGQEQQDRMKIIRNEVLPGIQARIASGKASNYYDAYRKKLISPEELTAAMQLPAFEKSFSDQQAEFFDQQRLDIENKRYLLEKNKAAQDKTENAALFLFEKAATSPTGSLISMDMARQIAANPKAVLESTDPNTQPVRDFVKSLRDKLPEKRLDEAKKASDQALRSFSSRIIGKAIRPEDLQMLNVEMGNAWSGTFMEPPVFGNNTKPGKYYGRNNNGIGLISVDPKLEPYFTAIPKIDAEGVPLSEKTKLAKPESKTQKTQVAPADAYESLKRKYPKETQEQLMKRVSNGES